MILIAFIGLSCYNVAELVVLVPATFRRTDSFVALGELWESFGMSDRTRGGSLVHPVWYVHIYATDDTYRFHRIIMLQRC
jgi:hypothetical protein